MARTPKEIDYTKPAGKISAKFGSVADFAEALEKPYDTIYGWVRRGLIPAVEQSRVLKIATDRGLDVKPADFIST